jgi:ribosomal-protein-alanine N-acetyltransferase
MTIAASRLLIRPMTVADIPRVSEIERESFPTMWPQTAYKRELQRNNLAAYLVICELQEPSRVAAPADLPVAAELLADSESLAGSGLRGLIHRIGSLLSERPPEPSAAAPAERILGFVGVWFMVGEAHIVTIAVAEAERRRGLGEALLIAAVDLAQRRNQDVLTLECRVSNTGAQALYEKYGFRRVGVRKRYYTDNDEDALIMTTFPIDTAEFSEQFERLRSAHVARRGAPRMTLPELSD